MSITHPDQIHEAFTAAANTRDVDAVLDLYDHDGINVEIDGTQTTGYEAMRASFEGFFGVLRHIEGTDRKIFVVGDVALTSAHWTAEFVMPDGSVVTQEGTTAEVSRRQSDGTWKVVIDDPTFA